MALLSFFMGANVTKAFGISEQTQGCFICLAMLTASTADFHKVRSFKNTSCYSKGLNVFIGI